MSREVLWNGVEMNNPPEQFRLGTDSMVLADFARPKKNARICDLGCGSGAISLMLLASHPTVHLTGVELQADAVRLAEENRQLSGMADRFTILQGDLREIRTLLPANGFTCVVSNPPYFPANSLPPQQEQLAIARTEIACTPQDLCTAAAWLLSSGGSFCLVHRPQRLADLMFHLRQNRLEPKRLQFVRHSPAGRRNLLLLEAVLDGSPGLTLLEDLILYNTDGSPTPDCQRIYHR